MFCFILLNVLSLSLISGSVQVALYLTLTSCYL